MNWNYNFHSDAKQSFLYYFLVYIAMHLHSLAIFVVDIDFDRLSQDRVQVWFVDHVSI